MSTLILPTALYGVESAPPADHLVSRLATGIATAISPHSSTTCKAFVLLATPKVSLDPATQIMLRRLKLARRMLDKHPWTRHTMQRLIMNGYSVQAKVTGAIKRQQEIQAFPACPPHGNGERTAWNRQLHRGVGPTGLLCNSLAEHKAGINQELIIFSEAHATTHLCHIPYHHLPHLADTLASASQVPMLAATRTAYKQLPSLDKHVLAKVHAKLSVDHRALLSAAQSLTMQSATNRWNFFGAGSGKCPFCGSDQSGIIHEAWTCPELKKVQCEEDDFLQVLTEDNTPTHTLLGIPANTHMSYDNLVLDVPDGKHGQQQLVAELCFNGRLSAEAAELMRKWQASCKNQGNLFAHHFLTTSLGPPTLAMTPIPDKPPAQPNAFSDGSVINPGTPFAHASHGTIFLGRTLPRTEQEEAIADAVDVGNASYNDGFMAVAAECAGLQFSSARPELAGLITAALAPMPIHVAADNQAVVTRAQSIIDDAIRDGSAEAARPRRPWGLQRDGDLWAIFDRIIRQRRPTSISVSWCKGHVTTAHIQSGADPRSAVYNGYADAAADAGHRGPTVAVINEVLDYLAKKQQRSYVLHLAIVKRIVRVAIEVLDRLERLGKRGDGEDTRYISTPAAPARPEFHEGLWLCFGVLPSLPEEPNERLQQQMVRSYWQQLCVVPTARDSDEHGTTWLELFIHFSLMGGVASQPVKPHLRQSHDRLFKAFRKSSKQVFRFATADTRPLLKAACRGGVLFVVVVGGPLGPMVSILGSLPSPSL